MSSCLRSWALCLFAKRYSTFLLHKMLSILKIGTGQDTFTDCDNLTWRVLIAFTRNKVEALVNYIIHGNGPLCLFIYPQRSQYVVILHFIYYTTLSYSIIHRRPIYQFVNVTPLKSYCNILLLTPFLPRLKPDYISIHLEKRESSFYKEVQDLFSFVFTEIIS